MPAVSENASCETTPIDDNNKGAMPLVYQKISGPFQKNLHREEVIQYYDKWNNYDDLLNPIDYRGPSQAVDFVVRFVPDRDADILDLAAGTGLVGKELIKRGYSKIDAVEPSSNLVLSGSRSLYQKHFTCYFGPKDDSAKQINTGTYDCVVSSGAYGENHLPIDSIDESLRVLKKEEHTLIGLPTRMMVHEFC